MKKIVILKILTETPIYILLRWAVSCAPLNRPVYTVPYLFCEVQIFHAKFNAVPILTVRKIYLPTQLSSFLCQVSTLSRLPVQIHAPLLFACEGCADAFY
jgi:hypothetical protein